MPRKTYPLPKRFNAALSEQAYTTLRELNSQYGYGNNYLLTILLENLPRLTTASAIDEVMAEFKQAYGAPEPKKK